MTNVGVLLIIVVFLALCFDYINGFHDTANAIATSVSTRALTPKRAVVLAAAFNLLGALPAPPPSRPCAAESDHLGGPSNS